MDAGRDITIHDLKLLSIGYYIQGGIAAFYTVVMAGYMGFLGTMLAAFGTAAQRDGQKAIPEFVFSLLTGLFMVIAIFSLATTICLLLAGYWLRRYRNKLFIFIVAALSCLSVPYGTVLGIFTFMVLRRPVAEELFGGAAGPPALPGA
jgi:zinc transporter ZupT